MLSGTRWSATVRQTEFTDRLDQSDVQLNQRSPERRRQPHGALEPASGTARAAKGARQQLPHDPANRGPQTRHSNAQQRHAQPTGGNGIEP
jgi:hypothetical protein